MRKFSKEAFLAIVEQADPVAWNAWVKDATDMKVCMLLTSEERYVKLAEWLQKTDEQSVPAYRMTARFSPLIFLLVHDEKSANYILSNFTEDD
jgi:hypothetical protein